MATVRRRRLAAACALYVGLVVLQGASAGAEEAPRAPPAPTGRSFFDDFSKLDRNRWLISHGWTNGPHQGCVWSASNARRITHGLTLVLNNRRGAGLPYSCGEVQTREFFGYGTFEVRMRSAAVPGIASTFFTYTGPPFGAGKPHDEISFELLGNRPGAVQLNYYASGTGGHEQDIALGLDPSTTTNDYAIQWIPDAIRWFVNRRLVHEVKRGDAANPFPSHPGRIILSVWTGRGPAQEAWMGRLEYSGSPLAATYEHVAFTALGEPCRFPASVLCGDGRKAAP
jgi:endo-1,3-1,4-beta-glycanase ExoK